MEEVPAALAPNEPVEQTAPEVVSSASTEAMPSSQPVKMPYGKAEQAILSGQFEVPAGKTVTVRDSTGSAYDLPSDRLKDAIEQGYTIETPEQGAIREYVKQNDSFAGAAKVAALQAGNQLLMDVPQTIFEHTANPFEVKKWEALKDSQELANDIGGVGGFAGSLFFGGPLFETAGKVGMIAERALEQKLAAFGIERGAKGVAKDLLARVAAKSAKFGAEGVVISAPRAVVEAALGDPKAAAESLMMGGGFGAALGVGAGATGKIFQKLNIFADQAEQKAAANIAKSSYSAPQEEYGQTAFKNGVGERSMPDVNVESTGSVAGDTQALGGNEEIVRTLKTGEANLKPNHQEIRDSAKILGLEPLPEQLTADKAVQDQASAIAQRTDTMIGAQRAKGISDRFDSYDQTFKHVTGDAAQGASAASVGQDIKQKLLEKAQNAIQPVSDFFNAIGEDYNLIPTSQKGLEQIANNIEKLDNVRLGSKSQVARGREAVEKLRSGDIKTISDLKTWTTNYSKSVGFSADPAEKQLMGEIVDKLRNHEESSIERYAKSALDRAGNAGEATLQNQMHLSSLYENMQSARGQWRDLIETMGGDLDAMGGKSNIKSPYQFINEVEGMAPEQVTKSFAPRNDAEALARLRERHPEMVESALNLEKSRLVDRTTVDGKIVPAKFIREFRKYTPEFQEAAFGKEGVKLINAVRTDFEALPRNINPSGTAKTMAWNEALFGDGIGKIPGQIMKNVSAAIADAKVRASVPVEGVLAADKSIQAARSKLEHIGDYIHGSKEAAKGAARKIKDIGPERPISTVIRLFGEDGKGDRQEAFKKLQKKMNDVAANPQGHAMTLAEKTAGLARSGAPKIAEAYQNRVVQTMQYVQQAMPKSRTVATPLYDKPFKPSDAELASFERKLSVVEDPQVALKALKAGTLSKDHVEALSANYPMFYQAMRSRIMDHLAEHGAEVPYGARLKLSMLLGINGDPTIEPQHIQAYQAAYAGQPQAPGAPQNSGGLKVSGLERLNPGEQFATPTERALARGSKN